jgi:hypothetical protein
MYVATKTRPDVLKEIIHLSTITQPTIQDQRKLKRVMGYLKRTHYHKITVGSTENMLEIFADASFGSHIDGKSHTGIIIRFGGSPILFKSYKQKSVTLSSTESELNSLIDAIKFSLPILEVIKELTNNSDINTIVYQDNMSTMNIVKGLKQFDPRNKFMIVRYNFLMEFFQDKRINKMLLKHCPTEKMPADILTKVIVGEKFIKKSKELLSKN